MAVTGHRARLGTRLLAGLYRGRHLRRQSSTHLHGATLIEPDKQISRIRLSDKTSRLCFRVRCGKELGLIGPLAAVHPAKRIFAQVGDDGDERPTGRCPSEGALGDAAVGIAGLLEPGRDIEIAFWIDPPGLPRKDLRKSGC